MNPLANLQLRIADTCWSEHDIEGMLSLDNDHILGNHRRNMADDIPDLLQGLLFRLVIQNFVQVKKHLWIASLVMLF